MTNIVRYRDSIKEQFQQREGVTITYYTFFLKAVIDAIKQVLLRENGGGHEQRHLHRIVIFGDSQNFARLSVFADDQIPGVQAQDRLALVVDDAGVHRAFVHLGERLPAEKGGGENNAGDGDAVHCRSFSVFNNIPRARKSDRLTLTSTS